MLQKALSNRERKVNCSAIAGQKKMKKVLCMVLAVVLLLGVIGLNEASEAALKRVQADDECSTDTGKGGGNLRSS